MTRRTTGTRWRARSVARARAGPYRARRLIANRRTGACHDGTCAARGASPHGRPRHRRSLRTDDARPPRRRLPGPDHARTTGRRPAGAGDRRGADRHPHRPSAARPRRRPRLDLVPAQLPRVAVRTRYRAPRPGRRPRRGPSDRDVPARLPVEPRRGAAARPRRRSAPAISSAASRGGSPPASRSSRGTPRGMRCRAPTARRSAITRSAAARPLAAPDQARCGKRR